MADDSAKLAIIQRFSTLGQNYTDFTITCKAAKWEVHRVVLALHSKVLAAACKDGFKEGEEKAIDLEDHEIEVVAALVQYLYNFDYPCIHASERTQSTLCFHIKMAVIADKYDVEGLKTLAETRFKEAIHASDVLPEALAAAAAVAYEFSPATKSIRSEIVTLAMRLKRDTVSDAFDSIEQIMSEYPEFAIDIVRAFSKPAVVKPLGPKRPTYKCPECYFVFSARLQPECTYCCPSCDEANMYGSDWVYCQT